MTNLLHETHEAIIRSGHVRADVVFVGSENREYACTWREFEQLADREYDSGYGAQEVASDLIVVFSDGRKMWRHEYDGSECWYFDSSLESTYEGAPKPISRVIGGMWDTLAEMANKDAESSDSSI